MVEFDKVENIDCVVNGIYFKLRFWIYFGCKVSFGYWNNFFYLRDNDYGNGLNRVMEVESKIFKWVLGIVFSCKNKVNSYILGSFCKFLVFNINMF